MPRAIFEVTQTTDAVVVDKVARGTYDKPGLEIDKPPRFSIDVVNPAGVEMFKLASGKQVEIRRNGQMEFPGIVETPAGMEGDGATMVTAEGIHRGYHKLRQAQCTSYDFDEDGNPATTRDAVTLNPWETFILRKEDGALDIYGNPQPIDGVNLDDYVRHLLGTRFVYQHRFEDNSHLLASQANARGSSGFLTVYRDGKTGDKSMALQRYRNGDTFTANGTVESVPLHNNDRNVSLMGNLVSAQVLIIGKRSSIVFNDLFGTTLVDVTNRYDDVTGHGLHIPPSGGPTTRNAVTYTKYNLGMNLDGVNDVFWAQSTGFPQASDLSYFYAGVIDVMPTGAQRAILGGVYQTLDPDSDCPWSLYVDSNGRVNYEHRTTGFGTVNFQTLGGDITTGTEFRVWLKRNISTGQVVIGVNRSNGAGSLYDFLYKATGPGSIPSVPLGAGSVFSIGTDGPVSVGRYYMDGGVFEARLWDKAVEQQTLDLISDPVSNHYRALREGTEVAAWFMDGETDVRSTPFTGQNPTLMLCRNAVEPSRTYTAVTLTNVPNYNASGFDAWTGSITFSGSEVNKNSLAYKITLPGPNTDTASTKIYYVKVIATTLADTGLTEGGIAAYDNPVDFHGEENWIATDVQGFNRLEALEKVRTMTEADITVNPNPHWDMWVDENLAFHFAQRRGGTAAGFRTYSFAARNLRKIRHEYYGGELAYQTIAYGAGSGVAQSRIVTKEDYASTLGGLYDANRDPAGTTRLYGDLPRIMSFVDSNERSYVALLRKARTFHRLHRDPIENVELALQNEAIPAFDVGDSIRVTNYKTRTNGSLRVINLSRSWSGDDIEDVQVEVGQKTDGLIDDINSGQDQTKVISIHSQPNEGTTGISGDGVYFTDSIYGVYRFPVQDGRTIERVFLDITTLPWSITSRGGLSATHTHAATAGDGQTGAGAGITDARGVSSSASPRVVLGGRVSIAVPSNGSFSSFTTVGTFSAGATETLADYIMGQVYSYNDDSIVHNYDVEVQVTRNSSGAVVAPANFTSPTDAAAPQVDTNGALAPSSYDDTIYTATQFCEDFTTALVSGQLYNVQIRVRLRGGVSGTGYTDQFGVNAAVFFNHLHDRLDHQHNITISPSGAHVHPFDFGIWQFDGDAGNGTGNPVYGTGIRCAVDPPGVTSQGIPNNFANERVPIVFGTSTQPQTIRIDVTGYMQTAPGGGIADGVHAAYFLATAGTGNVKALAVVSVTPVFKFREAEA